MNNYSSIDLNDSLNDIFHYELNQDEFPLDLKLNDSPKELYEIFNTENSTRPTFNNIEMINHSNEVDEENKELNVLSNINNFDLINDQTPLETEQPEIELSTLNKKRRRSQNAKFTVDSLIRKVKHRLIENLKSFINGKIAEKYNNNIGKGVFIKKLLLMSQKIKKDSSVDFNKDLLNKSLGDIFSENISTKITNYPLDHNKSLIQSLVNENNNDIRNYFHNLLKLTFLDALKHFRGTHKTEELNGLTGVDSIRQEYKNEPEYLQNLEYYIFNYEEIINGKRARKKRKQKCK